MAEYIIPKKEAGKPEFDHTQPHLTLKNPDVCPVFGSKEYMETFPCKDMKDLYSRGQRAAANGYGD